jgi:cytochrome c2
MTIGWLMVVSPLLLMATAVRAQQPECQGNPRQGRHLALRVCDVCHVVASNQAIVPLLPHYAPELP